MALVTDPTGWRKHEECVCQIATDSMADVCRRRSTTKPWRETAWVDQLTGATVWLTGLSGAGKTAIGSALARLLSDQRIPAILLDGDELRDGLNNDLGFTRADRHENVRRTGEVALLFAKAGAVAITASISPYAEDRAEVRQRHRVSHIAFIETYVATPLDVCEARDVKGLYGRARSGELEHFTGISDPYERPRFPDVTLRTDLQSLEQCLWPIAQALRTHTGILSSSFATLP